MPQSRPSKRETRSAAFYLQFRPVGGEEDRVWTVRLEAELLTLLDGEDKPVLKLHREEAARYLRFSYDIVRARIVTLVVIEGLKGYSFHCTKVELSKLLSCQASPRWFAVSAVGI
jgi:hypothetical protein